MRWKVWATATVLRWCLISGEEEKKNVVELLIAQTLMASRGEIQKMWQLLVSCSEVLLPGNRRGGRAAGSEARCAALINRRQEVSSLCGEPRRKLKLSASCSLLLLASQKGSGDKGCSSTEGIYQSSSVASFTSLSFLFSVIELWDGCIFKRAWPQTPCTDKHKQPLSVPSLLSFLPTKTHLSLSVSVFFFCCSMYCLWKAAETTCLSCWYEIRRQKQTLTNAPKPPLKTSWATCPYVHTRGRKSSMCSKL